MKCEKQYVGSTVTAFRKGFNNHKSSLIRYGKRQKEICGKHLYSHFYTEGHSGIKDFSEQIIDVTDVNKYILLNGLTYNPAEYFTSFERIFPSPERARKNARNE